jgi:septal ring factor EnvC (AmiA/AmiB activator)
MHLVHSATVLCAVWSAIAATPAAAQSDVDPVARAAAVDAEIARALALIEQSEARKARVDAEIEGLGERRSEARRRLRTRTRALYRLTRSGLLPLAGGFDALLGHVGRVERLERMVKEDAAALRSLQTRGDVLRAETGQLASAVERARAELRALEGRKQALERDRDTAAMFVQAFSAGAPRMPSAPAPAYGTLRVVDDDGGAGFASLRGTLGMPISGAVDIRHAQREDGPGLDFLAPPGTPVRAVAQGRVAFSDRYGSYGRLVIVDHGGSYFTVYGGLGAVEIRVGDVVSRGARIGTVGGDHRPTALFFEVRHGTRTLDAVSWIGL